MNHKPMNDKIMKYFDDSNGFGEHKKVAIKLLKRTIDILEEYDIKYLLISGTLLGCMRHNDFIPWDDDIDILVESSFLGKIKEIKEKYGDDKIEFIEFWPDLYKSYYKNKVKKIKLKERQLRYNWPFIDLFIYEIRDDKIIFFKKEWPIEKFLPEETIIFQEIKTKIPKEPEYYLENSYGKDYMTILNSGSYCHKDEKRKSKIKEITMEEYNSFTEKK